MKPLILKEFLKFAHTQGKSHLSCPHTHQGRWHHFLQFVLRAKHRLLPLHTQAVQSLYHKNRCIMINNFRTYITITVIASFLAIPSSTKAQGIPVIDTSSIAQTLIQIQEMARDYQNQLQQLDTALSTYNSLTGGRDIGDLLNSSPEQDLRRALPTNLQNMIGLNNASGLGASALQTQSIYNDLLTTYNPITGEDLFPSDPTGTLAKSHDRRSQTTTAAMAASETTYNNAASRMQGYETLLGELNTSPDLKSSVDLLARISTENGLLMNEILKLQALQIQLSTTAEGQNITNTRRISNFEIYNTTNAAKSFQTPTP